MKKNTNAIIIGACIIIAAIIISAAILYEDPLTKCIKYHMKEGWSEIQSHNICADNTFRMK